MKAKACSVACAGRVLVLKAGGMAAKRVADTISLCVTERAEEKEKRRGGTHEWLEERILCSPTEN